ncbi:MAG: TRAM domain-containing protein [Thermodesulfovibrionia bacterium]|nr:TRAM domain-containing protein [Thermodesulfovibrionia bacterium]MCK5287265.1 TRAM domain-containing protein [Thermodesulfovibrionia bacterium]MCK5427033.1 TRAM domain-containing protein [Thermodesulfovibrionia bacterium]
MISRLIFLFAFATGGYLMGMKEGIPNQGLLLGVGVGGLGLILEYLFSKIGAGTIFCGLIGLSIGIILSRLIYYPIKNIFSTINGIYAPVILDTLFGYSGLLLGLRKGQGLTLYDLFKTVQGRSEEENLNIIDTSAIIDGRIADVCETGFLEGTFVIPQFILQELQHIADSSDSLKRERGRRGLDVLHKIQKMANITVKIVDEDFPKIKEVDTKLVALAKMLSGKIITNDFNLNKVAKLQGVSVLNINELASSLKPVVLPGETMNVFIVKEGKESSQGIAYLEDGTMVVVDNARRLINKNIDVMVTSVLQTTAGRMIFTRLKEEADREDLKTAKH